MDVKPKLKCPVFSKVEMSGFDSPLDAPLPFFSFCFFFF
jgi:hypothetical protein